MIEARQMDSKKRSYLAIDLKIFYASIAHVDRHLDLYSSVPLSSGAHRPFFLPQVAKASKMQP